MSSKLTKIGYDLRDVSVIQAPVSNIEHRADIDPFIEICGRKQYPIIVSPMASVTDQNNYRVWIDAGFTPVVPRSVQKSEQNPEGITWGERMKLAKGTFVSVSLSEASQVLNEILIGEEKIYICIDLAHGTLSALYDVCKKLKEVFRDRIEIMTGNVANPEAYFYYADAGIDWMRISVGTGSRCTTAANTGIYYPSATLIDELYQEKKRWEETYGREGTKLIMDGGIGNFDDIQKALALGCDAVMSGNLFARAEEACGEVVYLHSDDPDMSDAITQEAYNQKLEELDGIIELYSGKLSVSNIKPYAKALSSKQKLLQRRPYREYYGMSTKKAQRITGGVGNKTAEGISRPVPVEYPIKKWADNMESFLRSNMSYTNSRTIEELKRNSEVIILGSSDSSYRK